MIIETEPTSTPSSTPSRTERGWRHGLTVVLAAAAALNEVSPRHAELFAATRLAGNHATMYGAVDLAPDDVRGLLDRALP